MIRSLIMERDNEQALINAIALRVGTARQLSERFDIAVPELRQFAADNLARIERAKARLEGSEDQEQSEGKALSPNDLSALWITNKFDRLRRLQAVAEEAESMILNGDISAAELTMAVREFRSYLALAANELGQLLHRGSGDAASGDVLSVEIGGVDMENLR